jgi:hypothetical protein
MPNEENWSMRFFPVFSTPLTQNLFWSFRSSLPISYESREIGLFLICYALVGLELRIDSVSRPKNAQNSTKNGKNKTSLFIVSGNTDIHKSWAALLCLLVNS